MSEAPTIKWPGKSGKEYLYHIYPIGSSFKEEAGNYAFAKQNGQGQWLPVYFGQTVNLNQRLGSHEKEDCATRNGATHIHAHLNSQGEATRLEEERDLIRHWQPACNEQLVG
jgi:hypothetical protein